MPWISALFYTAYFYSGKIDCVNIPLQTEIYKSNTRVSINVNEHLYHLFIQPLDQPNVYVPYSSENSRALCNHSSYIIK